MSTRFISLTLIVAAMAIAPSSASMVSDCIQSKLEPNLVILAQMKAAGLEPGKPRSVSQLFLGPTESLEIVRRKLVANGFAIDREQNQGRLLALTSTGVGEDWVRATIPAMCKIAADASVEYDGWDIDVASDNIKSEVRN